MQVDDALLSRLEKLSYLKISDDHREEIVQQLGELVAFVDNLSELDTEGVDDSFAMTDNGTYTRSDSPRQSAQVSRAILSHAPKSEDDFFIVPKIIE